MVPLETVPHPGLIGHQERGSAVIPPVCGLGEVDLFELEELAGRVLKLPGLVLRLALQVAPRCTAHSSGWTHQRSPAAAAPNLNRDNGIKWANQLRWLPWVGSRYRAVVSESESNIGKPIFWPHWRSLLSGTPNPDLASPWIQTQTLVSDDKKKLKSEKTMILWFYKNGTVSSGIQRPLKLQEKPFNLPERTSRPSKNIKILFFGYFWLPCSEFWT